MADNLKKYNRISRRNFILSTAGAVAGITLGSAIISSCKKQPGQKKEGPLEIDFIGPENYFPFYHFHFKKIKGTSLHFKTLDQALFTGSDGAIVLLPLTRKAAVILMLLEMEKDILTPFPLANDYTEFDAIQKQCNLSNRRIAILDPVRFWEPVQFISDQLRGEIGSVRKIEFIANSMVFEGNNIPSSNSYAVNTSGMIRLISCILRMNPDSLMIGDAVNRDIIKAEGTFNLELNYNGISLLCRSDGNMNGWAMKFTGDDLTLSINSEGFVNSEGSIKVTDDKAGKNKTRWYKDFKEKAFRQNINDFITTIRTRKEPAINSLDGMAGIALKLAAIESAKSGDRIRMHQ